MKKILIFLLIPVICTVSAGCQFIDKSANADPVKQFDNTTRWELKPSLKYDTLCFLNALVGDEYYLRFYQSEYDQFAGKFTPEVSSALREIKTQKDNFHIILGAWLCNLYSVTDDKNLDDMIATLNHDSDIWEKYKGSEEERKAFDAYGKSNLKVIFRFLKENGFENYWEENILPRVDDRIAEIRKSGLSDYNILPEIERYTGQKLSSNKVTVYLLYFAQPHGIRVQGTNFITDVSYPFHTVVGNAIHEMLHPPFGTDPEFAKARDSLKEDDLIREKMASQDKTHGYSTYESYFEENCVDALEVIIREKLKLLDEGAKSYFSSHDGGIDALGVALYDLMKEEDYTAKGVSFEEFILREVKSGKLAPGKIRELNENFFSR